MPKRPPLYPAGWKRYFEATAGSERSSTGDGQGIPQGERDATLASLAGSMRKKGLTETEIRAALLVINDERCDPPLDPRDVRRIAHSISRYPAGHPELLTIGITGHLNGNGDAADAPITGWEPQDVVELANNPHTNPDVGPLFYTGLRHVVSGESETGKSLLCLAVAADEILCGRHVLYIDFDGMGATMSVDLLRCLGVPDDLIRTHFLYLAPETPFQAAKPSVLALLDRYTIRFIVIDTFNPALVAHGLNPEKTTETDAFYRDVVNPLRTRGAAIALLDHVPKNKESRGRYSYGAEGKLTRCDVAIGLEARQPIGRGRTGIVAVKTHKDRPSRLPRPTAGTITWTSDPTTGAITWDFKKPAVDGEKGPFRPTHVMEEVSRYLEQRGQSTMKDIEDGVPRGRDVIRTAIQRLIFEEHAAEERGARGARLVEITGPYRQMDDPDSDSYLPTSPPRPTSPDLAPGEVETTSPPRPAFRSGEVAATTQGEDDQPTSPDTDDTEERWWNR